MVQGHPSAEVVGEDEGQIIDFLEHVRCCNYCFDILRPPPQFLTLFWVVQALSLTKARVGKRVMEATQRARVVELEQANSRLLAELEHSRPLTMGNWRRNVHAFMLLWIRSGRKKQKLLPLVKLKLQLFTQNFRTIV
jgi:hypothetical protein